MIYRNIQKRRHLSTLRLQLWLVRACGERPWLVGDLSQQLVFLSSLITRGFSSEAYTPTKRCSSGINWSKFGVHKFDIKPPSTERLHFTCGQLQLFTGKYSTRNWGVVVMGAVRASGAPDGNQSSWAARSDSRDVFVKSRLRASSAKKLDKTPNTLFHSTQRSTTHWLHHRLRDCIH